jgi:dipeptidyl aminopeptidase/acylaminoacyl peptidase
MRGIMVRSRNIPVRWCLLPLLILLVSCSGKKADLLVFLQQNNANGAAATLYGWRPDTQAVVFTANVDARGSLIQSSQYPGKILFADTDRKQYYWMDAVSGKLGDCLSCSWQPPLVFFTDPSYGILNPVYFTSHGILYLSPQGWTLRSWKQGEVQQVLGPDDYPIALSSTGEYILFRSLTDPERHVFLYKVSTKQTVGDHWTLGGDREYFSFSPHGDTYGFVFYSEKKAFYYLARTDGSEPSLLTECVTNDFQENISTENSPCSFAWSPDGTQLAVVRGEEPSRSDIYTVNSDGGGLEQITHEPGTYAAVEWSPSGRYLSFQHRENADSKINIVWVVDPKEKVTIQVWEQWISNAVWIWE